jgi:beta-fructofuranosidase
MKLSLNLIADPFLPSYHFCVPDDMGQPGDPNGAFYHNELFHLMYFCSPNLNGRDLKAL